MPNADTTKTLAQPESLMRRLRDVRWFGEGDYQLSEDVELGTFPVGGYDVWVSARASRVVKGDEYLAVGITARYKIFKDGVMVPHSDQRGISPVFSIQQILDRAADWLKRHVQASTSSN